MTRTDSRTVVTFEPMTASGVGGPSGYPPLPQTRSGTNGLAIGSLVASLMSLLPVPVMFIFWIYANAATLILAIAGIAMGVVVLLRLKTTPQKGMGLAVAGIAVGAGAALIALYGLIAPLLA
jgi:hypothetical protein